MQQLEPAVLPSGVIPLQPEAGVRSARVRLACIRAGAPRDVVTLDALSLVISNASQDPSVCIACGRSWSDSLLPTHFVMAELVVPDRTLIAAACTPCGMGPHASFVMVAELARALGVDPEHLARIPTGGRA